eukprot:TRINITY_DN6449_c1_g2_i1.p1 TRINITY_DN6449_c1_g2~~TRINITY_DN6449_c1_g2_i1.p1  ORF type:complete len:420 (+),score=34.94 TRINITY_DN6449_c1_g2_i1:166-1425(+)
MEESVASGQRQGADRPVLSGGGWGKWARRARRCVCLVIAAVLIALSIFRLAAIFVPPEILTFEAFAVLALSIAINMGLHALTTDERQRRQVPRLCFMLRGFLVLFAWGTYATGVAEGFDSPPAHELMRMCAATVAALGVYHVWCRRQEAAPRSPRTRRRLRRRLTRRVMVQSRLLSRQRTTEIRLRERCAALQHRLGRLRREFDSRVAALHHTMRTRAAAHETALAEARTVAAALRNELRCTQQQQYAAQCESTVRNECRAREELATSSLEQLQALGDAATATMPRAVRQRSRPPRMRRRMVAKAAVKTTRTENPCGPLTDWCAVGRREVRAMDSDSDTEPPHPEADRQAKLERVAGAHHPLLRRPVAPRRSRLHLLRRRQSGDGQGTPKSARRTQEVTARPCTAAPDWTPVETGLSSQ